MIKFVRNKCRFPVEMCKVCILGANGGIGKHLALKLKLNKLITDLALYDISDCNGLREDLSHIDTSCQIKAYVGNEALVDSLKCSNIVIILAGQAHSPEFNTREAMFAKNAGLMIEFMKATVEANRNNMPFIHIVTNPVNALMPLCAYYLKQVGQYNPRKLIGSTSVDNTRARTFLAQVVEEDPIKLNVPVVGGHSKGSIVPLVSQSEPKFKLSPEIMQKLEQRIINGAAEVSLAKKNLGAAQLAMGHCVAEFCDSLCYAIYGQKDVVEVGYVPSDVNELEFFGGKFKMDCDGITSHFRLPPMNAYELVLYKTAVKDIKQNLKIAKEALENYNREKQDICQ